MFLQNYFFPTFPKFFKDKHRLLVGGLQDDCQTNEFMALQVSEKQKPDLGNLNVFEFLFFDNCRTRCSRVCLWDLVDAKGK